MRDVNLLIKNNIDVNSSLELFGDIETYNETVIDFLEALNEKLDNINKYKESSDMANYAILVHSLKSDAKYLGLKSLAEISYKHEMESKANNVNFIYDDFNNLLTVIDNNVKVLKEYIGDSAPSVEIELEVREIKSDKKILVVDDSDMIRNYIKKMVGNEFLIDVAKDGIEALEKISSVDNNIVAMLLDLNMPNVNGIEVLEYMEKNNLFSRVSVAVVTGEDSKEYLDKVKKYPIIDILSKPFNERDIKIAIEKMI